MGQELDYRAVRCAAIMLNCKLGGTHHRNIQHQLFDHLSAGRFAQRRENLGACGEVYYQQQYIGGRVSSRSPLEY
jgi:hypothetical protein